MCVDFGDVYIGVHTNCMHSFRYIVFQLSLSVFFVLLPAKSEVSVHGEVLSSLWLATPTQYTTTLMTWYMYIQYQFIQCIK